MPLTVALMLSAAIAALKVPEALIAREQAAIDLIVINFFKIFPED
jgi:hypothetical protein